MYALIQLRAQPTHRARIIAANNILNALFMIASSVIAGVLLKLGMTIPEIFLLVGLANAVVAPYIFMLVPEYLLRFIAWIVSRLIYRFKVTGDENIPVQGAAILVCNHWSFVDPVLLLGPARGRSPSSWTTISSRCRCWAGCSSWPRPFPSRRARKIPRLTRRLSTRRRRSCAKETCSRSSLRVP